MRSTRLAALATTETIGLLLALGILVSGYAVPPPAGVDADVQLVLSVFFATVVLWVTEPVPFAVSSLLSVILLYALGLVDSFGAAVSGFAETLIFFFILLLLLGKSVSKVDLDDWVAKRLVSATSTPQSSVRRLSLTILSLAFIMPSGMARTVTFMPVIDQVNELYDRPADSPFRRLAYYVIGHVNPIGSMALMTGGGMAIITAEMINSMVRPITWVEWAIYMTPPIVTLFLGCIAAASVYYDVEGVEREPAGTGDASASADPLTREQWIVIATLFAGILMWIVGSFLGIPAIIPAMIMIFVFALPRIEIVTTAEFREISWGIIFLIGAMLSMLDVMEELDALSFVIEVLIAGLPMDRHLVLVLAILLAVTLAFRGLFSGVSASIVILLPMLIQFADILGLHPLFFSFALLIILGATTFVPFNQPTILMAFERGPLSLREVIGLGAVTLLIALAVVGVSWLVYWPLVDDLVVRVF